MLSVIYVNYDWLINVVDLNIHVDNLQEKGAKEPWAVFKTLVWLDVLTANTQTGTHSGPDYQQPSKYVSLSDHLSVIFETIIYNDSPERRWNL